MIKLWLKAETEQDLISALPFARVDEAWQTYTHDYALDILGTLYTDAVLNEYGEVVTPPAIIPGYHANIACKDWVALLIPDSVKIKKPKNPKTIWSGEVDAAGFFPVVEDV